MREEYTEIDDIDTSGDDIKSTVIADHLDMSNIQKFHYERSKMELNKNRRYRMISKVKQPLTIPWYLLDQVRGENEQFIQEKILARINPQKSTLFQ